MSWPDGIAIIGMALRFPQATRTVGQFWSRLLRGDRFLCPLSDAELRAAGVADDLLRHPEYVRTAGVLDAADRFDAAFFGYTRREAEIMDPQQRVFLECAWEAMENAGYAGHSSRTGVYASVAMNAYLPMHLLTQPAVVAAAGPYQLMLGNDKDHLATRVAYKLNLRGPAVGVQTACSASLAAVHLACRALLDGECDMALAGGVAIALPQAGYLYSPGMILSPDGYCRPFDVQARGTVPGRGAGLVLLKPLTAALAAGDHIYAVIRGTAWNNDGAAKVGYTAPSVSGQAEVIAAAQDAAGLSPRQFGYLEAHGTATELGDPIEVAALTQAFRRGTGDREFCALGSVKANLGHTDTAAGIAGLMKCALVLKHGVLPPNPYFTAPNPQLELPQSPFFVNTAAQVWNTPDERYAGVSSFGIGGTNVHACLSAAPTSVPAGPPVRTVFPVSARTPTALAESVNRLAAHLDEEPSAGAAYTLQTGRAAFPWRQAVAANTNAEAAALLRHQRPPASLPESAPDVVFLFPGQGETFAPAAVRELCAEDPAFCDLIEQGAALSIDLRTDLNLADTAIAQPALFLLEYALADRLQRAGVTPAALLGHSLGELTAAAVAGVFTWQDGLRLAAARGRLMQQTPAGAMLAIAQPAAEVRARLKPDHSIWIAAENAPRLTVVSGSPDAIASMEADCIAARIATIRLPAARSFHTPLLEEAATAFAREVANVPRQAPRLRWLSNVTGEWITDAEARDPHYWARHITSPVHFRAAAATLLATGNDSRVFVEVGPGKTLLGLLRQHGSTVANAITGTTTLADGGFAEALAKLWTAGLDLKWHTPATPQRVPLPTYPFESERFWVDRLVAAAPTAPPPAATAPLTKRPDLADWFYTPTWRRSAPATPSPSPLPQTWLILTDPAGLGDGIARLLEAAGHRTYRLAKPPADRTAGQQFFASLAEPPTGLVSCWGTRRAAHGELPPPPPAYDSLAQILQSAAVSRVVFQQVELVTDGLQSLAGESIEQPERAELHGLALVLPVEQSRLRCRLIDVEADAPDSARHVFQELSSGAANTTVAYRGGYRWVKDWAPSPIIAAAPNTAIPALRRGGTYLITGGTGGIGLTLAAFLVRDYDARLILTARRPGQVDHLGPHAAVYAADVADASAMRHVLADAGRRFGSGTIHGVIHAAGTGEGGFLTGQEQAASAAIRRPKVEGTRVLAELLKDQPLDFFLLCSSISSVVPAAGLSAYAAGNAYLDTFATWCRQHLKLPALSVHFDTWAEVGMAVAAASLDGMEDLKAEQLSRGIRPAEGVEVFRRALTWPEPELMVCTSDLPALLNRHPAAATSSAAPANPGEVATQVPDSTVGAIIGIWREVLAVDSLHAQDNFFSLGGHSLIGTVVLSRLRERFGVKLTLRHLFESPTPAALAILVQMAQEQTPISMMTGVGSADEREEFEI